MSKPFKNYLHKEGDWYLVNKYQISVSPPGNTINSIIVHPCPEANGACSYWYYKDVIAKPFKTGWCGYCFTGPSDELRGLWLLHNFDSPGIERTAQPKYGWADDKDTGIYPE